MKSYVVSLVYFNGILDLMLLDNIMVRIDINKIKPYNEIEEEPSIFSFLVNISQNKEYNTQQIIEENSYKDGNIQLVLYMTDC